jgi:hypothetical protein
MGDDESQEWEQRPDVDEVIAEAVTAWHPDLKRAHILGVGRPKAQKSKGKLVWASLKKASPLERVLYDDALDFILVVALDTWTPLPMPQRRALIDHELCHGTWDPGDEEKGIAGDWKLVAHDLEEFDAVVKRHGAWKGDVLRFLQAGKKVNTAQGVLPLDGKGDTT